MSERIFRYEVPVDDEVHEIRLSGDPVAVFCREHGVVEFWATVAHKDADGRARLFTVVGTGHSFPSFGKYIGTAVAPGGYLVWHLIEVQP